MHDSHVQVSSTADVNIFDAESQESMPEAVRRVTQLDYYGLDGMSSCMHGRRSI